MTKKLSHAEGAEEMSQDKKNSTGLIVVALVLMALAAGGFYYSKFMKQGDMTGTAPTEQTENQPAAVADEPIVTGEIPPQPETPKNEIVVETKKLDIPGETAAAPAAEAEVAAPATANPTVDAMMGKRSIGSPDAPIKVVEYSSLTCGHCAHFHKESFAEFKAKFVDTGKVEMIFKEYPLNPPALDASQILRCMPADKFVSFMSLLFEQQEAWAYKPEYKDALRQNAKLAGMSDEQFDACLANTDLKNRIVADMKAASDKFKIQSTPSFVVNDGKKVVMGNQPMSFFESTFAEVSGDAPAATPDAPAAQ